MQTFQLVAPTGVVVPPLHVRRHGLLFTPDGRYLYASSNTANLLDTIGNDEPGRILHTLYGFARGGTVSVTVDKPLAGKLTLNKFAEKTHTIHLQKGALSGGTVSSDGTLIYLAIGLQPGGSSTSVTHSEIHVLQADSMQTLRTFGHHKGVMHRLALSATGGHLVAKERNVLLVWDVQPEQPADNPTIRVRPKGETADFALSADGSRLAAVDQYALTIWDTTSGEQVVHSGKHRRSVNAVACSPTKPLIATGDPTGQIFLWDHAGHVLTRYDWGLGEVNALCFAPDGLRCAAADAKGKVVVWDVDV